jgi:hypothetical protein
MATEQWEQLSRELIRAMMLTQKELELTQRELELTQRELELKNEKMQILENLKRLKEEQLKLLNGNQQEEEPPTARTPLLFSPRIL